MSDKFGRAFDNASNPTGQSSKEANNLIRMDLVGMKGTKEDQTSETNYFEKQRFKSPSLATATHGLNTNVYLAYYDAMTNEIRFKSGSKRGDVLTTTKTHFEGGEYGRWLYYKSRNEAEGYDFAKLMIRNKSGEGNPGGFSAGDDVAFLAAGKVLGYYKLAAKTANVQIAKDGKTTLVFTFENVSDEQMSNLIENAVLEAVKAQTGDENATIEEYFADFFTAAQNSGNPRNYFSNTSGYFGND